MRSGTPQVPNSDKHTGEVISSIYMSGVPAIRRDLFWSGLYSKLVPWTIKHLCWKIPHRSLGWPGASKYPLALLTYKIRGWFLHRDSSSKGVCSHLSDSPKTSCGGSWYISALTFPFASSQMPTAAQDLLINLSLTLAILSTHEYMTGYPDNGGGMVFCSSSLHAARQRSIKFLGCLEGNSGHCQGALPCMSQPLHLLLSFTASSFLSLSDSFIFTQISFSVTSLM